MPSQTFKNVYVFISSHWHALMYLVQFWPNFEAEKKKSHIVMKYLIIGQFSASATKNGSERNFKFKSEYEH